MLQTRDTTSAILIRPQILLPGKFHSGLIVMVMIPVYRVCNISMHLTMGTTNPWVSWVRALTKPNLVGCASPWVRLGWGTRPADPCVGGVQLGGMVLVFFMSAICAGCFVLSRRPPGRAKNSQVFCNADSLVKMSEPMFRLTFEGRTKGFGDGRPVRPL